MEDKLNFAADNDDVAKEIAQAGMEFFKKNLRYADVKNYWFAVAPLLVPPTCCFVMAVSALCAMHSERGCLCGRQAQATN